MVIGSPTTQITFENGFGSWNLSHALEKIHFLLYAPPIKTNSF